MDEADWYVGLMEKNSELMGYIRAIGAEILCITEENAALINKGLTIEAYKAFAK